MCNVLGNWGKWVYAPLSVALSCNYRQSYRGVFIPKCRDVVMQ